MPRFAPTLYCDGAAVMRQVIEVNGTFPELRRGDHCVIPLNLARGAFKPFDMLVDFLSVLDLIAFHHHFVILNDVVDGEPTFVAEFTNEGTWGEDGYLVDKGLIPLPREDRATVMRLATSLAQLSM